MVGRYKSMESKHLCGDIVWNADTCNPRRPRLSAGQDWRAFRAFGGGFWVDVHKLFTAGILIPGARLESRNPGILRQDFFPNSGRL